jgi:hypothetical protein
MAKVNRIHLVLVDDENIVWVDTDTTATKAKAILKAYERSGVILREVA